MRVFIDPAEVFYRVFNSMLGGFIALFIGFGLAVVLLLPFEDFELFYLLGFLLFPFISVGLLFATIWEGWGVILFPFLAIYFYQLMYNDGDRVIYSCLTAISLAVGYFLILSSWDLDLIFPPHDFVEWCWFLIPKILVIIILLSRVVCFDRRKSADIHEA